MMKKEDSSFNQKFSQIGSEQEQRERRWKMAAERKARELSKIGVKIDMSSLEEQFHQYVQGILLLMLEDDSQFVRIAGIKAMSFFAKTTPDIRPTCLRFLIDLLNDEIDEVRIGALHGIASFNKVMILNESEVDTVLFNLTEDNLKLRSEIYKFFGEIIIDK